MKNRKEAVDRDLGIECKLNSFPRKDALSESVRDAGDDWALRKE